MSPPADDPVPPPASSLRAEFLADMAELAHRKRDLASLGIPDVLICGPPHEWETEYIPTATATWDQLTGAVGEAHRKGRDGEAVTRALEAALERLRPYMEGDPACTVEEALRREREAGQAPS